MGVSAPRPAGSSEQRRHVARQLAVDLLVVEPGRAHARSDYAGEMVEPRATPAPQLCLGAHVVGVDEPVAVAESDQLERGRQTLLVRRHRDRSVVELVTPDVEPDRRAPLAQLGVIGQATRYLRVEVAQHRPLEVAAGRLDDVERLVPAPRPRMEVHVERHAELRLSHRGSAERRPLDRLDRIAGPDLADDGRPARRVAELGEDLVAVRLRRFVGRVLGA